MGIGSSFAAVYNARTQRMQMEEERNRKAQEKQQRLHNRIKEWGTTLYEAMLIDDDATKNMTIDAISAEYKQMTGKDMSKPFVNWLRKNPEDAMTVLENVSKGGMSPAVFFDLADNPLMLSQGMIAMNKAKREREARTQRGTGGDAATAPSAPLTSSSSEASEPQQLSGPGFEESQPQPASGGMPTGGAAPARQTVRGSILSEAIGEIRQKITQRKAQIDKLASLGRPEAEIKPMRDALTTLEERLHQIEVGPALKGAETAATEAEKPISHEEYQRGVDQLASQGRRDLANRLRVGMNRRSFNSVMGMAGGGAEEPTEPTEAAPQPAQAPQPSAALAPAPKAPTGVMTSTERKEVETRTKEQIEGTERVASKQYEEYSKAGEEARKKDNAYLTLSNALKQAGPTGQFVGPTRQLFFNVAQMFGVQADALKHIQTAEQATLWLATQVLRDFSGPDSDKDFLRALEQNPGLRKVQGANQLLIALAMQENHRTKERAANANKWVGQYHSLAAKDERGRNFNQFWEEHTRTAHPYLTTQMLERVGINPRNVWKPSRNDAGSAGP